MKEIDVLIATRKIISQPHKWTQRTIARDEQGRPVPYDNEKAFSYCLQGAIQVPCGSDWMLRSKVQVVLSKLTPLGNHISFNDSQKTKHEYVLDLLDRAIAEVYE